MNNLPSIKITFLATALVLSIGTNACFGMQSALTLPRLPPELIAEILAYNLNTSTPKSLVKSLEALCDDKTCINTIPLPQAIDIALHTQRDSAYFNQERIAFLNQSLRIAIERPIPKAAVIQALVAAGADIGAKDFLSYTHRYFSKNSFDYLSLIENLIAHGVDIKMQDIDSRSPTPLHDAAYYGHAAVAKLLINRGDDVNMQNINGTTPLHLATRYCNHNVAKVLIAAGADVNMQDIDKNNKTPLHFAVENGRTETVELLINNGANIDAKTSHGYSPIDFARAWQLTESGIDIILREAAEAQGNESYAINLPGMCTIS